MLAWKPLIDLLTHERQLLRPVAEPFRDGALGNAAFDKDAVKPFAKGHGGKYYHNNSHSISQLQSINFRC